MAKHPSIASTGGLKTNWTKGTMVFWNETSPSTAWRAFWHTQPYEVFLDLQLSASFS